MRLNEDFSIEIKISERSLKSLDGSIVRVEDLRQQSQVFVVRLLFSRLAALSS